MLYPELDSLVKRLLQNATAISEDRKVLLQKLSHYVKQERPALLNFICTHNSRRSHLAQIWAAVAAAYFGLDDVQTFSGGTEATAFNPRAVAALVRAGFRVESPGGENPHYRVYFSSERPPLLCFSKTYDDALNPISDFAAIMTCSDADENCPFIPGAKLRLPLTYEDPKAADDTPEEANRYDERLQQIGQEILFAFGASLTEAPFLL